MKKTEYTDADFLGGSCDIAFSAKSEKARDTLRRWICDKFVQSDNTNNRHSTLTYRRLATVALRMPVTSADIKRALVECGFRPCADDIGRNNWHFDVSEKCVETLMAAYHIR